MADGPDDDDDPDRLYNILGVDREATQAELKRAYNAASKIFHPDRHSDPELRKAAESQFPQIQRAYAILSDEQQRAVYDAYGMKGIQAGSELAQYCTTREEIRAECRAREQLAKERREMAMADASSKMELCLDARPLFDPDALEGTEVEVSEMSLSQSIQTPVGGSDTLFWHGVLNTERGRGVGQGSVRLRHNFASGTSGDLELCAGGPSLGSVGVSKEVSPGLDTSGSVRAFHRNGGVQLGVEMSAMKSLGPNTYGILQWRHYPTTMHMRTGVLYEGSEASGAVFVQLGLPDSHVSAGASAKVLEHTRLKCSLKWGLLDTRITYGGERWVPDENNRIGASVSLGTTSGVVVKVKYNRRSQVYTVPIQLADAVSWDVALVATLLPVVTYACLQQLVISPYLRAEEERERVEARRRNRGAIRRARQEAVAQQGLMRETVQRRIDAEERGNGLVVVQALYGQLVSSSHDDPDDDLPLVVDVAVPLQCLVKDHKLELPKGQSKAGLLGFYDPCPGEPKSLRVRYRFQGKMHEVTVDDDAQLKIPLRRHAVAAPAGGGGGAS